MFVRTLLALTILAVLGVLAGCGGDERAPAATSDDAGPVHIHGVGQDPADGALFAATHTGLFRAAPGERRLRRVGDVHQDLMGFAVEGPGRFVASGHPAPTQDLPPFLGLTRSTDGGRSWTPVSLLGKADFHGLAVAGRTIYGFGSDFETRGAVFLASRDGGRTWRSLRSPGPPLSVAVDQRDPRQVVISTDAGTSHSSDGGETWSRPSGEPGLLAWSAGGSLFAVDAAGRVQTSVDGTGRWRASGQLPGEPAALFADGAADLLAGLHDGRILASTDRGRTWSLRAAP